MRGFRASTAVFLAGIAISVLVPWSLVREVEEPEHQQSFPLPVKRFAVLQNAPAVAEQPRFELAVEIGAELSGAYLQDRDGFLWVGTFGGGLYRYDGRQLRRFSSSTSDLKASNVTALYEDDDGVIWIGTLRGLNRYDKESNRFTSVAISVNSDTSKSVGVWWLLGGKNGRIWIATNGQGLLDFDPSTGEAVRYRHVDKKPDSLPHDNIYRIVKDRDGKLLLATFGGGAARFDPATQQVDWHVDVNDGLSSSQVWSISEDQHGVLWIGTQKGLDRFDRKGALWTHFTFDLDDPQSLGGPVVTSVHEDRHGALWVTSFNGDASLCRLDRATGKFTRYGATNATGGGLSQRGARTVFEDRAGIFWVVSMEGLFKFDRNRMGFDRTDLGSGLMPIYEDSVGTMWLGMIRGLKRLDRDTGITKTVADPQLRNQPITAIAEDSKQQFWVATFGGDLLQIDPKSTRVTRRFRHNASDPTSLPSSNCIRRIMEDRLEPGILWLATQGGGLARFNSATGKTERFVHEPGNPDSLANDTASYGALWQDTDGTLWVGTDNGFDRLQNGSRVFKHYWHGDGASGGLRSGVIQSLHRDRRGDLWIATSDGLHRLVDAKQGLFDSFTVDDGLSDNMVLGILEDRDRLWLSTSNGLTAFDPSGASPPQVFGRKNGLQGEAFLLTSFYKTRDGEFWFGGPRGVTHFRPDALKVSGYVPPVVLTDITQGGVPMRLEAAPCRVRGIELPWSENHFAFEAAALSYSMPHLNRYRYRLMGFADQWYESTQGSGRFTRLPAGQYLLQVQASNSSGIWNDKGVSLRVVVLPPVWQSQWFRTIALLVLTVVVSGATRYVELLKKEVRQRRLAEYERDQAEAQMRTATRLEAIGQLSAGVAHDFNNLLTVANCQVDFMRGLLEAGKMDEIKPALKSIEEAVMRGADLTHQLLAFSNRRTTDREVIDVNALVATSRQFLSRVLGEDIHIECDLAKKIWACLRRLRTGPSDPDESRCQCASCDEQRRDADDRDVTANDRAVGIVFNRCWFIRWDLCTRHRLRDGRRNASENL